MRPFLLSGAAPESPAFELEIPPGTVACGAFSPERSGRDPRTEYETKSRVRFREGSFELPTATETFALDLIEEVRFGPEQVVLEPTEGGRFRVVRIADAAARTIYRFDYEQPFVLPDGQLFALRIFGLNFTTRGETPVERTQLLDEEYLTFSLRMEGRLDGKPSVSYASCRYDLLPAWEIEVEAEGGTRIMLEERHEPSENNLATGPAALARAEVTLGETVQSVADYWRLVYSARRHNRSVRYWVLLDPTVHLPPLDASVRVLHIVAPEPIAATPGRIEYLDEEFRLLASARLVSYRRRVRPESPAVPFRRGDVDADSARNISDALALLRGLFSAAELACPKSADLNDSGTIELTDAIVLLRYLFLRGPEPPQPFHACGRDPTPDGLGCGAFAACGP